jgi:hypothetical protein
MPQLSACGNLARTLHRDEVTADDDSDRLCSLLETGADTLASSGIARRTNGDAMKMDMIDSIFHDPFFCSLTEKIS